MGYVYDVLINLNKELIEYFEWSEKDNIKYVKKTIVFKTSTSVIKDLIDYELLFDSSFINKIPKYEINNIKSNSRICLFTDGLIVIAVFIEKNKSTLISRLLLDEEYEVLEMSNNLRISNIEYEKISKKEKNMKNLTRSERKIEEKLKSKLNELYKNNDVDIISYLYYEVTNKENHNIDYTYKYLINSLSDFNEKHIKLFNILNMVNAKLN